MMVTFRVHGIEFERLGTCAQCGACGCVECPHHYEQDSKMWCAVYDVRADVCSTCRGSSGEEIRHTSCILYPDNPWIELVRRGICAYTFKRTDGGSMDDIPFLDGHSYRIQGGDHKG